MVLLKIGDSMASSGPGGRDHVRIDLTKSKPGHEAALVMGNGYTCKIINMRQRIEIYLIFYLISYISLTLVLE